MSKHDDPKNSDKNHDQHYGADGAKQTADLARNQIDRIYNTAPVSRRLAPIVTKRTASTQHKDAAPDEQQVQIPAAYNRHHSDAAKQATQPQPNLEEYHSAWQNYYQQYYGRYYQQQLEVERQKHTNQADHINRLEDKTQAAEPAAPRSTTIIHSDILDNVKRQAKKVRHSNHFLPLVTALCVGILFSVLQYNKVITAQVSAYVSPSQSISDNIIVDPNAITPVGKDTRLIIPKINVDVPIVLGLESLDNDSTQKALENGVVHYPIPGANSLPGQTGNNVILGHSSNDVFAPGNYKFAFVLLERLEPGDLFYIHYQEQRFVYRINEKAVISPSQVNALVKPSDKPLTTLVTCTPIGTDDQRLLVFAEQISPDPATAEKITPDTGTDSDVNLPGNEGSFLQRLFGF